MPLKIGLPDESATNALAAACAAALPADCSGLTLLLRGELGAGKSTFARALIFALGHRGTVPSPTYTLVEPYELPVGNLYHIDLYRISDESELRYLGFGELDEGFRLVEWPERAPGIAGAADLTIALAYDRGGRTAAVTAHSAAGERILARIPVAAPTESSD